MVDDLREYNENTDILVYMWKQISLVQVLIYIGFSELEVIGM